MSWKTRLRYRFGDIDEAGIAYYPKLLHYFHCAFEDWWSDALGHPYAKVIREGDGLGAVLSGVDPNAYMDGSGKFMPFFGADRLSKEQIRHIIAFVKNLPAAP